MVLEIKKIKLDLNFQLNLYNTAKGNKFKIWKTFLPAKFGCHGFIVSRIQCLCCPKIDPRSISDTVAKLGSFCLNIKTLQMAKLAWALSALCCPRVKLRTSGTTRALKVLKSDYLRSPKSFGNSLSWQKEKKGRKKKSWFWFQIFGQIINRVGNIVDFGHK